MNAQFALRSNSGRTTTDIAQAARAATMGAIATLLVNIDGQVPGTIDEESGAVQFAEAETASNYGIVDEIARRALLSGAQVLAVRAADLPGDTPLAAILRWPISESILRRFAPSLMRISDVRRIMGGRFGP